MGCSNHYHMRHRRLGLNWNKLAVCELLVKVVLHQLNQVPGTPKPLLGPAINTIQNFVASVSWWVLFMGVPIMRALLFGVYIGAPDFWKLPFEQLDPVGYISMRAAFFMIFRLLESVIGVFMKLITRERCSHQACPNGPSTHKASTQNHNYDSRYRTPS